MKATLKLSTKENKETIMNQKNLDLKTSNSSCKTKQLKLKNYIQSMNDETKFKFWIKTLISSQSTIPEIIKAVDKIITIQASSVSFASDIYNKNKSTYSQVEKVIDLTERKNSLVNIYVMTKEMTKSLTSENYDFMERKFIYNWNVDDLAKYYNISARTVYRKTDKIINDIYTFCINNKWNLKFIEMQTKEEGWLKEKFIKLANDYFKNSNYKELS